MLIITEFRTCSKCHQNYGWNPNVGNYACPYCGCVPSNKEQGMTKVIHMFQRMKKRA